jgi:hypothetical protein
VGVEPLGERAPETGIGRSFEENVEVPEARLVQPLLAGKRAPNEGEKRAGTRRIFEGQRRLRRRQRVGRAVLAQQGEGQGEMARPGGDTRRAPARPRGRAGLARDANTRWSGDAG